MPCSAARLWHGGDQHINSSLLLAVFAAFSRGGRYSPEAVTRYGRRRRVEEADSIISALFDANDGRAVFVSGHARNGQRGQASRNTTPLLISR